VGMLYYEKDYRYLIVISIGNADFCKLRVNLNPKSVDKTTGVRSPA